LGQPAQAPRTIGPTWDPKAAVLPKYDWLYGPSIPPQARYQLLSLYQRADLLSQELYSLGPEEAYDTFSGFLSAPSNDAARTVQESAGAVQPYNAALSAQTPGEKTAAQSRAKDIETELDDIARQIYDVRKAYNIETIGPARSSLFQRPKLLTPEEVTKILMPAARPITQSCYKSAKACYGSCRLNTGPSTGGAIAIIDRSRDDANAFINCMNSCSKASATNEVCIQR